MKVSSFLSYIPVTSALVYITLAFLLTGALVGWFLVGKMSRSFLINRWTLVWVVINCCLLIFLYGNVVSPLTWFGRLIYTLLFLGLLIALSSLFLLHHEIIERDGLVGGKRWAFNVITLWSIIGTLVLLLEVFFRIIPVYDTLDVNPGVKFFWPDYVYFPLNNLGYRDRNFVLSKSPHTYRIMVVGDSFTEGAGCRREDTFSRVLERRLNQDLQSSNCEDQVEVYNLGVCGANTVEEVQRILKEAPILKPDLIILAYFPNDPEVHPLDLKTYDPPLWVSEMHKIFIGSPHEIHEKIHSYAYYWFFTKFTIFRGQIASMKDWYLAVHKLDYHGWQEACDSMSKLSRFIKKSNYDFVEIIFPAFSQEWYSTDDFRHIHKQVYNMIREKGLDVIDLLGFYEGINKDFSVFCFSPADGHPNILAHKVVGAFLAESVWDRGSFKHFRENCQP
jgi:hypothetical protein